MQKDTLIARILELSRENPESLQRLEMSRLPVTVMFTDIKDSTAYFEQFGDAAGLFMIRECNELLERVIESHKGKVIEVVGDSVMAAFQDCDESIRAAIAIQLRLRQQNAARKNGNEVLVRIGLHHGNGVVTADHVFGDVVNVASRVQGVAEAGQIVISDSLQKKISSQFDLAPLGRFHFKGKSDDRDLFEVRWNDTATRLLRAHAIVAVPTECRVKLERLGDGGAVIAEYPLTSHGFVIGETDGAAHPAYEASGSLAEARFWLQDGQPMVTDLNGGGAVYIRLVAPYSLEQGDVIAMGRRLFQFAAQPEILAAAATLGRTLSNLTQFLNEAAAELVVINTERVERYPLPAAEVRFGRTKGTYLFADDSLMSRSHARVYQRGGDFFIEDLLTRNGTFVRVRDSAPIPLGTSVLVGKQMYRVIT